jgi:hypothetical protein
MEEKAEIEKKEKLTSKQQKEKIKQEQAQKFNLLLSDFEERQQRKNLSLGLLGHKIANLTSSVKF